MSIMRKLREYLNRPLSFVMFLLIIISTVITALTVVFIIGYIFIKGVPNLSLDLFSLKYSSSNQSMLPSIINTVYLTALTLLLAVPIGIFSAIYLAEYSRKNSFFVKIINIANETLSGIPSIVFGLFGYLMFNLSLGWGFSMLAGVVTLAMMILPLIIRTTEEALLAVPDSYREGSFGLGAGKMRTVFRVILPTAVPGIMSGVILAIGRIVGESAALIFTSGSGHSIPGALAGSGSSAATLTVHMYILSNEGLHVNEAFASAVVLLALTFIINLISDLIERHIAKKKG